MPGFKGTIDHSAALRTSIAEFNSFMNRKHLGNNKPVSTPAIGYMANN